MKTLTRKTRPEFVAAFPQFAGKSTSQIREALKGHEAKLELAGWRLPTGEAKAKRAEAIAAHKARKEALAELSALASL